MTPKIKAKHYHITGKQEPDKMIYVYQTDLNPTATFLPRLCRKIRSKQDLHSQSQRACLTRNRLFVGCLLSVDVRVFDCSHSLPGPKSSEC